VEYVAAEELKYEEIVEVYEEEVPVQEGVSEPSTTNFAVHQDAQAPVHNLYFELIIGYLCYMCIYVSGVLLKPTCINITIQESY
jgi:hypothetical protein